MRSAREQSHSNLEIVIIDNCSTDGTWELLQRIKASDSRIHTYQNEANLGPWENWKRGLEKCTGEYLKVLWSDDTIAQSFVEQCLQAFADDQDIALVFTGTILNLPEVDLAAYNHPHTTLWSSQEYVAQTILRRDLPVSPGCAMLRRMDASFDLPAAADTQLRDFATRLGAGPDVYLLLNAASKYGKVAHIPRFLSFFSGRAADCITLSNASEVNLAYEKLFEVLLQETTPFMRGVREIVDANRRKERKQNLLRKICRRMLAFG